MTRAGRVQVIFPRTPVLGVVKGAPVFPRANLHTVPPRPCPPRPASAARAA